MGQTAATGWRIEKVFSMRIGKEIMGILLIFILCGSQIVPGMVRKFVSLSIENKEIRSYGKVKGKSYVDVDKEGLLQKILLPDVPSGDRLLKDIPITDKPGLLEDLSEEKEKEIFSPEIHRSEKTESLKDLSGTSDILQNPLESVEVQHPAEQRIPEVENSIDQGNLKPGNSIEASPIEVNPPVLNEPVEPVVPVEPIQPEIPAEPIQPEVPVEPIESEVPVEPIEPEVPVEPIEPEVPAEPIQPEEPGVSSGEGTSSCFLLDEDGVLFGFQPEYAVIERGCLFLPYGCTGIRRAVFSGCGAGIKEVYIPASVTWIEEGAFIGLSELEWIEVEGGNTAYIAEEGVLFDCTQSQLLAFPNGRTETYLVPPGVLWVADSAFEDTSLSRIDVRDCHVIRFGENVFGSSNGNGVQIRVPWGTGSEYAEILAGYAIEIVE